MWMVAVMLINLSEWIVYVLHNCIFYYVKCNVMIALDTRGCVGGGAKSLLKFQEVDNDCLIKLHHMMTVLLKSFYC